MRSLQRGHDVTLIVRPDTETPPRDPFAFYGLSRIPALHVEVVPVTGPAAARRAGYLTFAIGRSIGRARQDILFTRDLGAGVAGHAACPARCARRSSTRRTPSPPTLPGRDPTC